jgi:predicted ATPase
MTHPVTFRARNFRRLKLFEWSPTGTCLLSGANGAGKTTALDMLRFLRATFVSGHEAGFHAARGGDHFPSRGIGSDELVEFEVVADNVRWTLKLPMSNAGLKGPYGEELYFEDKLVLRAAAYAETWSLGSRAMPRDDSRCCAKVLWDRGEAPWMEALFRGLYDLRTYDFFLNQVEQGTTKEDSNSFLHSTGKNLWAVLANWKQAPLRFRGQFDWVLARARRAFPDLIDTIEFVGGEAFIFPPGATDPADGFPPRRQPAGLLTGLLQLTAIIGAKRSSILAFDEVENQLHPHAIRSILEAMREQSAERDLLIVLTTHSPIVMNEFKGYESGFYLLEPAEGRAVPIALDAARPEAWLSHFDLGALYEREKFSAPGEPPHVPTTKP